MKYRLTLKIVAVSALCFVVTWAYFLLEADRSARARIATVAEITAEELELQRSKMDWVYSARSDFPDLQTIATALMAPGLCIAFRANSGDIIQRFCSRAQGEDTEPPTAFAVLYRTFFDPGHEAARVVRFRGKTLGETVAWADPAAVTAGAWHDAGRLIPVMVITLLLLSGLVYAALAARFARRS